VRRPGRFGFVLIAVVAVVAVVAFGSTAMAQQAAPPKPLPPVAFGEAEAFPATTFNNLNGEARIDLAQYLGEKPVVLFYWIAGHPRADQAFVEMQELVDSIGGDKLALLGVALQQPGRDATAIGKRLTELGITVPVLDDEGFRLGQQLRVQSVPNVTIIDTEGKLRLTNGASLLQAIEYEMDLGKLIRRVARKGTIGTRGYLERYFPVQELVGKKCPEFNAQFLGKEAQQPWSSMISASKLNVLIFWSVDCPHCRKSLPEIDSWLRSNAEGLNVISAARIKDETVLTKTLEFCGTNDFAFPTLVDDNGIADLYNITSTPTIVFIRPDGVVDSILFDSQQFADRAQELKKKLL